VAVQGSRYCRGCRKVTLHAKQQFVTDGVGCFVTLITAGLFLLLWFPAIVWQLVFPNWRCQTCGRKN
jgi:hypothetical protein